MEFMVHAKGFLFAGRWQDLFAILTSYPPETTLRELIHSRLN